MCIYIYTYIYIYIYILPQADAAVQVPQLQDAGPSAESSAGKAPTDWWSVGAIE